MNIEPVVIITNPKQLAQAFDMWMEQYEKAPETFGGYGEGTYGEDCAAFLVRLLETINKGGSN